VACREPVDIAGVVELSFALGGDEAGVVLAEAFQALAGGGGDVGAPVGAGQAAPGGGGDLDVAVDPALAGFRQDRLVDQEAMATVALAGLVQGEALVLLAVATQQVLA
jgi:hypothetical protein